MSFFAKQRFPFDFLFIPFSSWVVIFLSLSWNVTQIELYNKEKRYMIRNWFVRAFSQGWEGVFSFWRENKWKIRWKSQSLFCFAYDKKKIFGLSLFLKQSPKPPEYIFWYHNDRMINYGSTRDLSIETETGSKTQSRLIIKDAQLTDEGNYTCETANAEPASTLVYISQGKRKYTHNFSLFAFFFAFYLHLMGKHSATLDINYSFFLFSWKKQETKWQQFSGENLTALRPARRQ